MDTGQVEALVAQAQAGDLVLFSGRGLVSGTIRLVTGSRWSHVGVVVGAGDGDGPLLLEATITDEAPDVALGRAVRGVQLVSLRRKLAAYDGGVALRRLELEARPAGLEAELREIAGLWRYRGYKSYTLTRLLDWASGGRRPQHVRRLFCSELVAEVYKRLGIMARDVRSSRIVPGDFGSDLLPLVAGVRLSPPVPLK